MADDRQSIRTLRLRGARARDPDEHAAGDRVGPWIVGAKLGGGGFGHVYEARHETSGQIAALKLLKAQFAASGEMLARFDREIRVLKRMRHCGIVQVIDAGFDRDGRPYLCMERLVGHDLATLVKARGRFELDAALAMFEPLCEAVSCAHELGVVHRDLKASNVFVCEPEGRIVLLDFGIAKLSDALAPELTASHQSLGTPGCMAPEQIRGARADTRTDIYALGALLFHVLTGRLPFDDPSETMTQYLHLHARRPRASALVPVPAAVDDVIVRAMAVEPNDRFGDIRGLFAALRGAVRESPQQSAPTAVEQVAVLVTIRDRTGGHALDEPLLADLEAVLPIAERWLCDRGFSLALDLGTSAVFLGPACTTKDAVEVAGALWDWLEQRATRDARVEIGTCVHRGLATFVGQRVEPCALLQPETWGMPEPLAGAWISAAIEPSARRVR